MRAIEEIPGRTVPTTSQPWDRSSRARCIPSCPATPVIRAVPCGVIRLSRSTREPGDRADQFRRWRMSGSHPTPVLMIRSAETDVSRNSVAIDAHMIATRAADPLQFSASVLTTGRGPAEATSRIRVNSRSWLASQPFPSRRRAMWRPVISAPCHPDSDESGIAHVQRAVVPATRAIFRHHRQNRT